MGIKKQARTKVKGTVPYWKKKAWEQMSIYIRRKYADWRGYVKCITCGEVKQWKQMQGGHFIPGRRNSIIFDERNVHPQCVGCNMFKAGNPVKYFRFMQQTYGEDVIKELEEKNEINKQFTVEELIIIRDIYKQKKDEQSFNQT